MSEEKPIKLNEVKKSFWDGLFAFLREYSVIGLAIGVIIAQTSKDLVDAIVKGLFTPLIDLIVPGDKIKNLVFTVKGVGFDIGAVISAGITFIIVMALLYVIVKKILKKEDLIKKK